MQLISIGQFHKVIEKYLYWLSLPSIGFTDILEIIIISVIVYQMLKWVQLTRAWTLFKGIIMLLLFALFAAIFQLNTISWLLSNSLSVGITAAIIIFQPELRRALEQLGRKKISSVIFFHFQPESMREDSLRLQKRRSMKLYVLLMKWVKLKQEL